MKFNTIAAIFICMFALTSLQCMEFNTTSDDNLFNKILESEIINSQALPITSADVTTTKPEEIDIYKKTTPPSFLVSKYKFPQPQKQSVKLQNMSASITTKQKPKKFNKTFEVLAKQLQKNIAQQTSQDISTKLKINTKTPAHQLKECLSHVCPVCFTELQSLRNLQKHVDRLHPECNLYLK